MSAPNCRDCRHCSVRRPTDSRLDMCHAIPGPAAGFYCTTERALRITGCGPHGLNFEPKPRPWYAGIQGLRINPFDSSTNTGRFVLLFTIIVDSFCSGAAFAEKDYFVAAFGALIVTVACMVLGGFLYERES